MQLSTSTHISPYFLLLYVPFPYATYYCTWHLPILCSIVHGISLYSLLPYMTFVHTTYYCTQLFNICYFYRHFHMLLSTVHGISLYYLLLTLAFPMLLTTVPVLTTSHKTDPDISLYYLLLYMTFHYTSDFVAWY